MPVFRKSLSLLFILGLIPLSYLIFHQTFRMEGHYEKAAQERRKALGRQTAEDTARIIRRAGEETARAAADFLPSAPASSLRNLREELSRSAERETLLEGISYWELPPLLRPGAALFPRDSREGLLLLRAEDPAEGIAPSAVLARTVLIRDGEGLPRGFFVGRLKKEALSAAAEARAAAGFAGALLLDGQGRSAELFRGEKLSLPRRTGGALIPTGFLQEPRIIPLAQGTREYLAVSSPLPPFSGGGTRAWILALIFSPEAFYGFSGIGRPLLLLVSSTAFALFLFWGVRLGRIMKKRFAKVLDAVDALAPEEERCQDRADERDDEISCLLLKVNRISEILNQARQERQEAVLSLEEARSRLEENRRRFRLINDGANDAIWHWDIQTGAFAVSKRWNQILGMDEAVPWTNMNQWFDVILPEDRERVKESLQDHLKGDTPLFSAEYRVMNHSSGMRWIFSRGLALRNEENVDILMAGSHTDITLSRKLQEKLHFNAYHDVLTNLPNRMKLRDRIEESLLRRERDGDFTFSLLYLDFDGFKHINDSFGHGVGDMLLVAIAERLSHCVRPLDLIARIGGDEFVVLLDNVPGNEKIQVALDRIMREMRRPFHIDGHLLYLSVSIGIAQMDGEVYGSADEMIQRADIAMFRAKNEGKAQYVFYENSMGSHEKRRWFLENEMHKALGTRNMQVHYQPVADAASGALYGMEALLRWRHDDQGFISPGEFIPIAEESGFINQITRWLLFQVCRQAVAVNEKNAFGPPLRIALNISSRDFHSSEGLDEILRTTLRNTGCRPEWIAVEVTEGTLIKDFDIVLRQLKKISDMGILIELDDFGTGYSSLSYLNRFPLKILKVDRSFIMTMNESDSSMKLVQTIIHMAKDLGMRTIAEGVEEESQRALLADMGCDFIQGYLIAKPLPAQEILPFLSERFWKSAGSPSPGLYL